MKRTSLYLIFFAIILSASLLWADSQARIVRLSLTEGSVELDRAAGQGFERAILNMPITQGMRLRTAAGSNAEVEFENGSTLRLIGNTTVSFGRLSLGSDGNKLTAINVEEGTAYFNVAKQKSHDEFAISFAGREIRVTQASRLRVDVSDSRAEVAMFKGEAEVAGDANTRIGKDQTLAFDRDAETEGTFDQAPYDVAQGVTEEPSDAWDQQRQEQYARQLQNQQSQLANSPYSYGISDLDMYGSYYSDPAYGYVWRPYNVGLGWDPFADGAWMWYPGFGYTWVSPYPWGWMPYRYGRWVFLPAYGWAWQPGYWNNWWRGPVIVNAPRHWVPPIPPRHRDHHVVWVGNPQPHWPAGPHNPNDRDHDRDRDRIHVREHDNDDSSGRKSVTMSAPGSMSAPGNTNSGTAATNFTGNGTGKNDDKMIVTTPGDRDIARTIHGPGSPRNVHLLDNDNEKGDNPARRITVIQNTRPSATPHVDRHQPPSAQPHSDAARSTTPHATPPGASSHSGPAPSSRPSPSPHMEAPHSTGGSHSSGSHEGGGRSPK